MYYVAGLQTNSLDECSKGGNRIMALQIDGRAVAYRTFHLSLLLIDVLCMMIFLMCAID